MSWYWEKRGDNEFTPPQITTIFQGWEDPKAGLFSEKPVPDQTEIFVREVVQNFVDASREEFSPGGKPKLTFRFVELAGDEAARVVKILSINDIADHYGQLSADAKSQLRIPDSATLAGKLSTVKLLIATEQGTSGMFGQWERSSTVKDQSGRVIRNKMRDAMLSSVRDASAGKGLGSFGEGKKAVIAVSAPRTIFAYTCFDPSSSADNVYSRFLGALYWENHNLDNTKYAGLALLGKRSDENSRPEPFVDAEADSLVDSLHLPGLQSRKHGGQLETGTTLMFLDPSAKPEQIVEALARNWWPMMINDQVEFEVIDTRGEIIPILLPTELKPFIDAYQAQQTVAVADWETAGGPAFQCDTIKTEKFGASARLSLSVDLRPGIGFSRSNPEKNWSLVALIRDGMIVRYQHVPKSQSDNAPFVRGVLEVTSADHPGSEAALRKIEPPLHNDWPTTKEDVDSATVKHSREIWNHLKKAVEGLKKNYSTNIPDSDQDLPLFRELLGISGGSTVTPPVPPPIPKSPFSMLNDESSLEDGGAPGTRIAKSSRKLCLRKGSDIDELEITVQLGWEVSEDGSWRDVTDQLFGDEVSYPSEFKSVGGARNMFTGTLGPVELKFSWTTKDYRELWTLRPVMTVVELGGDS